MVDQSINFKQIHAAISLLIIVIHKIYYYKQDIGIAVEKKYIWNM